MHKQRVAKDFSASAKVYDSHAFLQQRILRELTGEAVAGIILDAGTGTGMLADLWPKATIIGLDIADGMCRAARNKIPQVMVADMESLPLADAVVDGVISSLAVQWLPQPEKFYAEAWRVCKSGGWLRIATLSPKTLHELRAAYIAADLTPPVLDFTAGATIRTEAQAAGWKIEKMSEKVIYTSHKSVRELLHYLKNLGARHKQGRGLKTPADLRKLEAVYASADNKINATWQIVMLEARKP
jgi:malonyl-CoA O-methyltransferase